MAVNISMNVYAQKRSGHDGYIRPEVFIDKHDLEFLMLFFYELHALTIFSGSKTHVINTRMQFAYIKL